MILVQSLLFYIYIHLMLHHNLAYPETPLTFESSTYAFKFGDVRLDYFGIQGTENRKKEWKIRWFSLEHM